MIKKISFEQIKELSHGGQYAVLSQVSIHRVDDPDADLTYLDQYEDSNDPDEQEYYEQDQQRKEEYGDSWHAIGIYAKGVIYIPTTSNGFITQPIQSPGLYGIEDDSDPAYLQEVENDEKYILFQMLDKLTVIIPDELRD